MGVRDMLASNAHHACVVSLYGGSPSMGWHLDGFCGLKGASPVLARLSELAHTSDRFTAGLIARISNAQGGLRFHHALSSSPLTMAPITYNWWLWSKMRSDTPCRRADTVCSTKCGKHWLKIEDDGLMAYDPRTILGIITGICRTECEYFGGTDLKANKILACCNGSVCSIQKAKYAIKPDTFFKCTGVIKTLLKNWSNGRYALCSTVVAVGEKLPVYNTTMGNQESINDIKDGGMTKEPLKRIQHDREKIDCRRPIDDLRRSSSLHGIDVALRSSMTSATTLVENDQVVKSLWLVPLLQEDRNFASAII